MKRRVRILPTEFEKLEDIRIAYRQHGSGQDMILLHGNSVNNSIFRAYQLNHFSMFHTYALDSRGHGLSASEDDDLSLDQISEDVIRFCQAKGMRQVYLLGYSDGGNIALMLAKKAPQLFTRIIAISPNTRVSGTEENTLGIIRGLYHFIDCLNRIGMRMKKHKMRFELMLKDSGISDTDLKDIHAKVLLLYAERDMVKENHILHITRLIPDAKAVKIPGRNHLSILRDAYAINEMRNFLLRYR